MPSKGSIGADDLAPLAHLGRALLGDPEAEAEVAGDILPADAALARAGLTPPVLGLKDGHAVVANALSVGQGCLVLEDARVTLEAAREPVSIELNAAADNPLVAVAEAGAEGGMPHNGNFDMTALVRISRRWDRRWPRRRPWRPTAR